MSTFLLDTDSVSYALRGQGRIVERILLHPPSEIFISAITLAELRLGAERKGSRKIHRAIDGFLEGANVLPFDQDAATRFGTMAAVLLDKGTPIGQFDTLIAAQALAQRATLVSNNTRHFSKVPGLKLENWL